ncbi:hypothetical protein [Kitasatospora fiedleri]|uniref:hypothetical protein n=1 Tax=Kitasatospora fiedleri TaxID=2991545 RepID=UPI00249BC37D|nr:hypothetical protein [Kitasatospora fiedleri]
MITSVEEALLQARENMTPFFDAADGMRRDLEARGWSPAMAEQVAAKFLILIMTGGRS